MSSAKWQDGDGLWLPLGEPIESGDTELEKLERYRRALKYEIERCRGWLSYVYEELFTVFVGVVMMALIAVIAPTLLVVLCCYLFLFWADGGKLYVPCEFLSCRKWYNRLRDHQRQLRVVKQQIEAYRACPSVFGPIVPTILSSTKARVVYCKTCGETIHKNALTVICPDCGTPHHVDCWEYARCGTFACKQAVSVGG